MNIKIYLVKECGLDTYKVYLNGTLHSTWMSREYAMTAAQRLKLKISKAY
jgi:hypothetical protein